MRFHVRGYYGYQNTGDDALAYATLRGLNQQWPSSRYFVASASPLHLPVSPSEVRLLPARQRFRGQYRLRELWEAGSNDATVFGGGSILNDSSGPRYLQRMLVLVRAARMAGRRVAFLGVGVGPLSSTEGVDLARRTLALADLVAVRDAASADACSSIGVERPFVTGDLALTLPQEMGNPEAGRTPGAGRPLVGVSLCYYDRYIGGSPDVDAGRLEAVVRALRLLQRRINCRFLFFQFNGHQESGDGEVVKRLLGALGRDVANVQPYNPNPTETMSMVGKCDVMVAMRLHAAVFAYLRGTPVVMLGYHPKCQAFATEVGMKASQVLSATPVNEHELVEAIERSLADPGSYMGSLPAQLASERSQANFRLLAATLNNETLQSE